MAGSRRYGYYRTPAQQAQLKRAQLISAQRRRARRKARIVGGLRTAGVVVGAAAVYGAQQHLNRYAGNWREAQRDYTSAKGAITRIRARRSGSGGTDPNAPHMPRIVHNNPTRITRKSVRYHMASRHIGVAGRRIRR